MLSKSGDCELGGQDIDLTIVKHYINKIKEDEGVDLEGKKKALAKLKSAAQELKLMLSANNTY